MIKIFRATAGKTYSASVLPSEADNSGARWIGVGPSEEFNVTLKMPGKHITVDLVTWHKETDQWVTTQVEEANHPDLTLYV
jgi:hypothetical protein